MPDNLEPSVQEMKRRMAAGGMDEQAPEPLRYDQTVKVKGNVEQVLNQQDANND